MPISKEKTSNMLWKVLTACWYITIVSAIFYEYLFPITLPAVGHMFLFRIAVPVTFGLFVAWAIRYRYPVFKQLSKVEFWFLVLVGAMAVYTATSLFWCIEVKRWLSKGLSIAYSLCFTLLFLYLCRDKKVFRNTVIVAVGTLGFCALGGFVEFFTGAFFDTPHAGGIGFTFFDRGLYTPIFCFYNTNSFAASTFWGLLIGALFLAEKWSDIPRKNHKWWNLLLTCGIGLCFALYMAGSARMASVSIVAVLVSLAIWYILQHKRGLVAVAVLVLFFQFVYIGINYAYKVNGPAPTDPTISVESTTPSDSTSESTTATDAPTEPEGPQEITTRQESDKVRVNLLLNGLDLLNKSNWLGIGVGNTELRMLYDYNNVKGVLSLHCFVMELFVEYGIFAIIPFTALLITLLVNWVALLRKSFMCRNRRVFANTLFQFMTAFTFPLMSSANSSSWTIMAMWLYLAYLFVDITNKNREYLTDKKGIEE